MLVIPAEIAAQNIAILNDVCKFDVEFNQKAVVMFAFQSRQQFLLRAVSGSYVKSRQRFL